MRIVRSFPPSCSPPLPIRQPGDTRSPSQPGIRSDGAVIADPVRRFIESGIKPDNWLLQRRESNPRPRGTTNCSTPQPAGHCFRVSMTHRGAFALCEVVRVMTPDFPRICELLALLRTYPASSHPYPGCPGIIQCPCGCVPVFPGCPSAQGQGW